MIKSVAWAVGLLFSLSMAAPSWATLGKLVRQEVRPTASGASVLVCIYALAGREVERVYPVGNFCPLYAEE